jgi:hypothetical protein
MIMPGKLERVVFSDATAAIFVKKKTKGTRSTKRHATKGRGGTSRILLWGELIDMTKAKGLAVSAAPSGCTSRRCDSPKGYTSTYEVHASKNRERPRQRTKQSYYAWLSLTRCSHSIDRRRS